VLIGFSMNAAISLRLTSLGLLGARFFYTLSSMIIAMASFSIAVLVIATSIAAIRAKVFPVFVGWAGAVLGLLWIVAGLGVSTDNSGIFAIGFVAFLLWMVWILVISFFLSQPHQQVVSAA
jgi:hypothetical protein